MTVIVDYGMGNLRSVEKACQHLGHVVAIQRDLTGATKVILPGVGAFAQAMENLGSVASALVDWIEDGQPLLGICLGQQLLLEVSEEFGETKGLGVVGGRVRYFGDDLGLSVPQMGWNDVETVFEGGLMAGVEAGDQVYFVHSLYTECTDHSVVAGWTEYGVRYASAIQQGNLWATQFHPEKSGTVGLRILENFLRCS